MAITKTMMVFAILLVLISGSFAGCASEAYAKTCASCGFDKDGKVDQSCSKGYQTSGTACVSTSYPIMAGKYATGQCPQVDECAAELSSCNAQMSTGDDKADCAEGSKASCYAAADVCTRSAAVKCGEIENQTCGGSSAAFVLLFAGLGFVHLKNRK
jgi:hypothetical protein